MAARLLLFVLLMLPALRAAQAQPAPDTTTAPADTVALPEVRVEAARLSFEAPGLRTTTLGRAEITATAAQNVAGLLERRTGLFVKRYGPGGLATVSLRGTGAGQTLVLGTGQRVADPQTGQVDLSLLPTVLLSSVTVGAGAQSARYGSGALGGVVHLRTLHPTEALRLRATAGAGAYGQRRAGLAASGGQERLQALAALEWSTAEGDFPYVNTALYPPRRVRREGAGRRAATAFGTLAYTGEALAAHATAWYTDAERGLPGTSHTDPAGARQWDRRLRLMAQAETPLPNGTLRLDGQLLRATQRYAHPAGGVRDTTRTATYALGATAHLAPGPDWLLTGGFRAALDRAALRGGLRRTRLGAFLSADARYGRLALHPALRLDTYLSEGRNMAVLSPSLGLRLRPLSSVEGLRLKARLGRAFRAPTLGERYRVPGGNPALQAEDGWSAEAGAALRLGAQRRMLRAEVTVFALRLTDQIIWYPSYVGPGVQVWRPRNVGRVLTRGAEVSLRGEAHLLDALALNGGLFFTHTDARRRANPEAPAYGKQLRYVPRQQLKLHLGLVWQRWRLDFSARLVSRRYVASDESVALAPYQVVDAHLRYALPLGPMRLTLGLTLENALSEDYHIIQFYPMPPRHLALRLTLSDGTF